MYIMWNAKLYEAQAGIKIARKNINKLRYADDTMLMARNEEELKSLLMMAKEKSEKAELKLMIQKTKIMTSGPIISWQVEGGKVRAASDFVFLGSTISVDIGCSLDIQKHLLLGRKAMTNIGYYKEETSLCWQRSI